MSEKAFNPSSKRNNEDLIIRQQRNFSVGVVNDIPPANLSNNSLYWTENILNYGNKLETRPGSDIKGNPFKYVAYGVVYRDDFTVGESSEGYSCTNVYRANSSFFSNLDWSKFKYLLVEYVSYYDSKFLLEKIWKKEEYNTIYTYKADKYFTGYSLYSIYPIGEINCVYIDKDNLRLLINIDDKIFRFDFLNDTYWEYIGEIKSFSRTLGNYNSTILKLLDKYYIYNNNGLFYIDLDKNMYFWINSNVPKNSLVNNGNINIPFIRRYTYTFSRLNKYFSNRLSDGNYVIQETGNCALGPDKLDYCVINKTEDDYKQGYIVGNLSAKDNDGNVNNFYTHYSIYATLDIGANGYDPKTGVGNNPELFVWVDDVPIHKAFLAIKDFDNRLVLYENNGFVSRSDIGSVINLYDYANPVFRTTIRNVWNSGGFWYIQTVNDLPDSVLFCCGIGTSNFGYFYVNEYNNEKYFTSVNPNYANELNVDVGDVLLSHNSNVYTVKKVVRIPNTEIRIYPNEDIAYGDYLLSWIKQNDFYNFRSYCDENSDEVLASRIGSMPLYQRFYKPVPNGNLAVESNGFVFFSSINNKKVYYSELNRDFSYLFGFYHEVYQYVGFSDYILGFAKHIDNISVLCRNSIYNAQLNVINQRDIKEIGVSIPQIPSWFRINDSIGMFNENSLTYIGNGLYVLFCNDKSIRILDGKQLSDNLIVGRIDNILKSIDYVSSCGYHPKYGFLINVLKLLAEGSTDSNFICNNDKLLLIGLFKDQPIGVTQITGAGNPLNRVPFYCFNYKNKDYFLFVDKNSGCIIDLFYNVDSYNKQLYKDDLYGDIYSVIKFPADTGQTTKYVIEHLETKYAIDYLDNSKKEIIDIITDITNNKEYVYNLKEKNETIIADRSIISFAIQHTFICTSPIVLYERYSSYIKRNYDYNLETNLVDRHDIQYKFSIYGLYSDDFFTTIAHIRTDYGFDIVNNNNYLNKVNIILSPRGVYDALETNSDIFITLPDRYGSRVGYKIFLWTKNGDNIKVTVHGIYSNPSIGERWINGTLNTAEFSYNGYIFATSQKIYENNNNGWKLYYINTDMFSYDIKFSKNNSSLYSLFDLRAMYINGSFDKEIDFYINDIIKNNGYNLLGY